MASLHSARREMTLKEHDGQGNLVWKVQGWESKGESRYITANKTQGCDVWKQEINGTRMLVGTLKLLDDRYWLESTTCKTCGAGNCADCRCSNTDADMQTDFSFSNVIAGAKHMLGRGPIPVEKITTTAQIDTEMTVAKTAQTDADEAANTKCSKTKTDNEAEYNKRVHDLEARRKKLLSMPSLAQQLPSLSEMVPLSSENEFCVRTYY
jgi:hypothetical protein